MEDVLKANGVVLPAPVELKTDDEIIWASNTGRMSNGDMSGDVITEKKTITIKWKFLMESELKLIKDNLIAGFFPFSFRDDSLMLTISTYRGTLSKTSIGRLDDGVYWYSDVSVKIIQK